MDNIRELIQIKGYLYTKLYSISKKKYSNINNRIFDIQKNDLKTKVF